MMDIIEMIFDEADLYNGINFISLVDSPAIEEKYKAFSNVSKFSFDDNRMIVSGAAMIPDKMIYRNDNGFEYLTFFSKETIEKLAYDFMAKGRGVQANINHSAKFSENTFVFESWISDSTRGVTPMQGFEHLPDGTWFISMKVNDSDTWQQIKAQKLNGFSIEGMFSNRISEQRQVELLMAEIQKIKN
jgi:hypothetical protein